jgi:2-polyprenyl-6-methoxyphenol hydroxylase-like FAD-dependent oxidoreductase
MNKIHQYAIVGGGIGGLTLAVALQRKGFEVKVYENAPAWKPLGAGLALAGNAIKAFREIGIEKEILQLGKVIKKVYIKDASGRDLLATDSEQISKKYGVVNNFAIHRADLHEVLLSLLKPGTVELNKRCIDFTAVKDEVKFTFQDGTTARADFVIASDGIHSIFRQKLLPESKPRYSGYTCWRAVVHNLPPDFNFEATSETWGAGARFGIVPLTKNRVYWFATLNAPPADAVMKSFGTSELLSVFENFHSPVKQLLERTRDEEIIWSDIIDLKPLRKFAFGNIVLVGDAAHATTPNMGQGACMAIEDACVLAHLLERYEPRVAFANFETQRIKRTTKIVSNSWTIGKVAQWRHPILVGLRNWLVRNTPPSTTEKQFQFIYNVSLR